MTERMTVHRGREVSLVRNTSNSNFVSHRSSPRRERSKTLHHFPARDFQPPRHKHALTTYTSTSLSCRPLHTTKRLTKRRDDGDATSVENSPPHAAFSTCNQLRSSPPPLQDAPRKPEELVGSVS